MPHDTIDNNQMENDEEGENMVSNLPLLFAAGYPTSLEKISESQLEKFIPFMVQCSLGEIQLPIVDSCREPEWWPEDVPFTIPLKKPSHFSGDWFTKLKEIVAICYQFHKSVFLLRFCENLSMYQTECLRFINNYNSTTSLFDRISNKLLVTFRNENMLYDQEPTNHKKTLMPRTTSSHSVEPQQMVEQSLFDIYLCDNCEAELYSLEAYQEHEKTCHEDLSDDDDVIFCGEEEHNKPEDNTQQQQTNFLQNFQLCNSNIPFEQQHAQKHFSPHKRLQTAASAATTSSNNNNHSFSNKNSSAKKHLDEPSVPDRKIRRVPQRSHAAMVLSKCPAIPISSPAGQRLITTSSAPMTEIYQRERNERYERFCPAPLVGYDGSNRPRFMDKKFSTYNISTYRSNTKHYHFYKFPRRQWSTKSRDEAVAQYHRILMKESNCKPLSVSLGRLSHKDVETLQRQTREKKRKMIGGHVVKKSRVIDFIDLCTDSESSDNEQNVEHGDDEDNENVDNESTSHSTEAPSSSSAENNHLTNAVLFIDCSQAANPVLSNGGLYAEAASISSVQSNTVTQSQCDSTSNLIKLLATHRHTHPVSLFRADRLQSGHHHDNRLYQYVDDNSNSAENPFGFENDMHNDLTMNAGIVTTQIASKNFMSIDLTLS